MNNRNYNVFFNLHTVSGIILSVGLFIIFFAGAFALFLEPIGKWEVNRPDPYIPTETFSEINYDRVIDSLEVKGYPMYGRYMYVYFRPRVRLLDVYIGKAADSLVSEDKGKAQTLKLNTESYELSAASPDEEHSFTIAELLYGLHFFEQLGEWGLYTAGAFGLMLLFALVSGIVIHWEKIISNFYVFRPKEKLKTVWTDAHTALGVIGIPFQLMYAVTGAMLGISVVIGLTGSLLYAGDEEKMEKVMFGNEIDYYSPGKPAQQAYSVHAVTRMIDKRWPDFKPIYIQIFNIGTTNMLVDMYGEADGKTSFHVGGKIVYNVSTNKVLLHNAPFQYGDAIYPALAQIHFGALIKFNVLGNYLVKTFYFLLAIATCFVIISGVLIWLQARNKKNIPEKERTYNEWVGHIYLAICLSMFPVTALSLLVSKLTQGSIIEYRSLVLNAFFFGGWLVLSIFFALKKNNSFTNKYTLLAGGITGLLLPVANGIKTNNWLWHSFSNGYHDIVMADLLWIVLAATALYTVYRLGKKERNASIRTIDKA